MLISAGFITGTRTATVPQAQRKRAGSAQTARTVLREGFIWWLFPEAQELAVMIANTPAFLGSTSLQAGREALRRGRLRQTGGQGSRELSPCFGGPPNDPARPFPYPRAGRGSGRQGPHHRHRFGGEPG